MRTSVNRHRQTNQVALLSEVPGGMQLLAIVYRDKAGQYITLDGDPKVRANLGKALRVYKYRLCDAAKMKPATAPSAPRPPSEPAVDAGGMLLDPKFKSAYHRALGAKIKVPWLAKLDGPSPLTKKLKVAGTEYVLVSSCKNHDCADNNTVVLYSTVQGMVYGKIYERGKTTLIGAPPPAVVQELERLWRAEWRQTQ